MIASELQPPAQAIVTVSRGAGYDRENVTRFSPLSTQAASAAIAVAFCPIGIAYKCRPVSPICSTYVGSRYSVTAAQMNRSSPRESTSALECLRYHLRPRLTAWPCAMQRCTRSAISYPSGLELPAVSQRNAALTGSRVRAAAGERDACMQQVRTHR